MAQVEPMDIDNVGSDFDDKENSLLNSNVLPRTPCTEKGYEELDVSELNMKLRYSITPVSSPMSKSYTASCKDNKTYSINEDSFNSTIVNSSTNLSRSLNSTITKCDIVSKSPKLPLQALPTDQYLDMNSTVRRSLDNDTNNITITINENDNFDENLSLPSTSSSTVQTPEATTPTKEIPKDGGSPIMRGLKSVLNMFRSSQSPIPPEESTDKKDSTESHIKGEDLIKTETVLASTPKASDKNKDNNSSKRSSPLKDSVVFNDDLERELQWKDETTIIFKQEKIPIHKLFLQQATSLAIDKKIPPKVNEIENLNSTVEYMDISYNESGIGDKTMTDVQSKISVNNVDIASGVESDGEFLDCETTYTKNEQFDTEQLNKTVPVKENNDFMQEVSNDIISQINEQEAHIIAKDTEFSNVTKLEADVQFEDQEVVPSTFNDIQSDNNIINDIQKHINDEIYANKDINVTTVLEVSADKIESNNFENQSGILVQHNLTNNDIMKENSFDKENNYTCSINEEIYLKDVKETTFDVTTPLNIVTDDDNILLNGNNTCNDSIKNIENIELNDNKAQYLNSGILQIFENVSDNTVQENANSTLNMQDLKSEMFDLEENKTENHVKNEQIVYCSENSQEIPNLTRGDLQKIYFDRVELSSVNDTLHLNTQQAIKEDEKSSLNLIENEIPYIANEILEKTSDINNLEHNNPKTIENNAKMHDPAVSLVNHLPSDIPLPIDDDIEKDSLMDNFVIKSENIEELDVQKLDCCIKVETIDSLVPMDVVSQESAEINSEHSKEINNLMSSNTSVSNLEEIESNKELNTENVLNIPTSKYESINKTETLPDSVPTDLLNNTIVLPDTIPELNINYQCPKNFEFVNDEESALLTARADRKPINDINPKLEDQLKEISFDNINEEQQNDFSGSIEGLQENKVLDDEIVTSENNSPFVSVNDLDLNVPKNDVNLDEIESPFETKSKIAVSPPISPKLTRKGYNINFDEIDDPFATKTNIRMSPTPESSPKNSNAPINIVPKKQDIQKRIQQQNRRKSQPERQKRDLTKKRFNNSYSCDTKISNYKEPINAALNVNDNKLLDENNKIDLNSTVTTPARDSDDVDPIDNKYEVDNFNHNDKNPLNPNETVIVQDEIKSLSVDTTQDNSTVQNSIIESTSAKKFSKRNVFNLPEIDDMNFNPFVSKSKIRNSPSPTFEKETFFKENETPVDPAIEITQLPIANLTLNIEKTTQEDKVESSDLNSETRSTISTDRDVTREIATEDEDTVEGPFLEAEEFADVVKISDFGTETDMMQFEDLHAVINQENKDEGELFIDAEAFEFLLNQNKSNVVADSGKESLFLKFDPLFAKRVSSDGVLAALNRIQKRQSTPKKVPPISNQSNVIDEEKASVSSTNFNTLLEESNDENNITVTKPMMVVNPAINSLVSPRKSTTPPRINRRSLTFTSPAMAVIDRLLSLSGNSSTLDHETSPPRTNREYNETDVALTQLRELLAEKEIHVHNLRSESKELKERLTVMESQVKTLEKESQERLKNVNDLNDRLAEKTKINKSMAVVVEEYERTIASLISEMEQEKRRNAEERAKIISERDEQTAHLASMEVSFSDLHSKYEKSKQIILSMKANEDTYKKSMKEFEENLLKMQNNYELLKQHATSKLNHANQELEKFNKAHESEVLKLNAMIKRKELHITSLEESLAQKTKANEELTAICDELINKVG